MSEFLSYQLSGRLAYESTINALVLRDFCQTIHNPYTLYLVKKTAVRNRHQGNLKTHNKSCNCNGIKVCCFSPKGLFLKGLLKTWLCEIKRILQGRRKVWNSELGKYLVIQGLFRIEWFAFTPAQIGGEGGRRSPPCPPVPTALSAPSDEEAYFI